MLSPRTERDYRQVVERWTRDGQPDPATWVAERSSEATRRNARAGLIWHFRVNVGTTLDIPWVRPMKQPVPSAFSVEELAVLREEALAVHRRCRPVIDLLYSTGARLQEACGITLEDVTNTHIVLRDTKRRPGGVQVHRTVPLGPVSRVAVRLAQDMEFGAPKSGASAEARAAVSGGDGTAQRLSESESMYGPAISGACVRRARGRELRGALGGRLATRTVEHCGGRFRRRRLRLHAVYLCGG